MDTALIYAPNIQAAIYRQALHYAHQAGDPYIELDEARSYLNRYAIDLAAIFPPAWCNVLSALSKRPPVEWTDRWGSHLTLLSADEKTLIEKRDVAFTEMDAEIPWANLTMTSE
jgi:hypothetical protein